MAIAIGLNVLCVIGCLVQVKIAEKQEANLARKLEDQNDAQEEAKEN